MKTWIVMALGLVAAFASGCGGNSSANEAKINAQLTQLNWLVGNWEGEQEGDRVYEQWTKKTDNTLQGRGYVISGKSIGVENQPLDTIFSELMTIGPKEEGIAYQVQLAGQPNTDFMLAELSNTQAVFVNPDHDFPQRITYMQQSDGTLKATVEGMMNGNPMREEFNMRRVRVLQ